MKFDFSALNQPMYPIRVGLDSICVVATQGSRRHFQKEVKQDKYFFCLTMQGEGEILSDGVRIKVEENTFVLLHPEQGCSYRCTGDEWQFWWVEFYSPEQLPGLGELHMIAAIEEACFYLEKCLALSKRELGKSASSIMAALLAILCDGEVVVKKGGKLSAQAARHVSENLNTVTVAGLCKQLNVSDRTLRNLFHRWFDMSPKRYILKCRMELARQLLEETNFSVGEVAAQLGFANPFHFSGSFKGYYGVAPTEYRKKGIKDALTL